MTPIPAYATQPSPLEMAIFTSYSEAVSIFEIQTALAVLDRDGDPKDNEHFNAYYDLHRRLGRAPFECRRKGVR